MERPILYSYFRSSSAYRVRIALHLKGIEFETRSVHLVKEGGEQLRAEYEKLNPMKQVPLFIHKGRAIAQSVAIIEYIDTIWDTTPPRLYPEEAMQASRVRQICEIINSGIQPHQNLRSGVELQKQLGVTEEQRLSWWKFWIERGFQALEKTLVETVGEYSLGNEITAADAFVIPQVYNARRFGIDMDQYPNISKVNANANLLKAFQDAHPDNQPDAPKN